jgi:uncharacterized surface protein with fasciclin (FAS1) repeats
MFQFRKISMLIVGLMFCSLASASYHQNIRALQRQEEPTQTIAQILADNHEFSALFSAMKSANVLYTFNQAGSYTLFAPTDLAFSKMRPGNLQILLRPENVLKLRAVLLYHVVNGAIVSSDMRPGELKSLEGHEIKVAIHHNLYMLNGHAVVANDDIVATNGVIHVINAVLMPPTD